MNIIINTETDMNIEIIKPRFKPPTFWIQKTDFCINDQIIETLNSDTMQISYSLYSPAEKQKQLVKLVTMKETKDYWIGIVPLSFWFTYTSVLALPILAMPYVDILLNFKIENLYNLILNDMTNCTLSQIPQIKIELNIDSIILDTNERMLFGSTQHEYLIETYKIYPTTLIYKTNQIIPFKFYNLVKDIILVSQPIYHLNNTFYSNIIYTIYG